MTFKIFLRLIIKDNFDDVFIPSIYYMTTPKLWKISRTAPFSLKTLRHAIKIS